MEKDQNLKGLLSSLREEDFTLVDLEEPLKPQYWMKNLKEKALVKGSNIYYSLLDYSTKNVTRRFQEEMIGKKSTIYILGHVIDSDDLYKELTVQCMFYFSYRRFAEPIEQGGKSTNTDTLWGCSIRCVQMLFARLLFLLKEERGEIIQLFLDNSKSPLSIHNICKAGIEKYKANIEEYWTPLTALLSARDTLKQSGFNERIEFITFHNNSINFKDIIPAFRKEKNMVVLLVGMFGDKHVSAANYKVLKECLMLHQSVGMIGGIGNRAMYVVGFMDDDFLIEDPHYTEEEPDWTHPSNKNDVEIKARLANEENYSSKEKIKLQHYEHFDACMCLAFLIRSYDDLQDFTKNMSQIATYNPEAYLYISGDIDLRQWLKKQGFVDDQTLGFLQSTPKAKISPPPKDDSDSDDFVVIPKNAEALLEKKLKNKSKN